MPSMKLLIASSMVAASGLASNNSSSSGQGSLLPLSSVSRCIGGCPMSGTRLFASLHAPQNPVKQVYVPCMYYVCHSIYCYIQYVQGLSQYIPVYTIIVYVYIGIYQYGLCLSQYTLLYSVCTRFISVHTSMYLVCVGTNTSGI